MASGNVEVIILTQDTAGGATTPLSKAWVYWKSGDDVTVLHTDEKGRLFSADLTCTDAEPFPDATLPWVYTARYTATKGAEVDLYFSRGYKPIPTARLNEFPAVFQHRKVETPFGAPSNDPPQPPIESATVAVKFYNALAVAPTVTIILLNHDIQLKKPYEASLWPLLWELVPDDGTLIDHATSGANTYYTQDLAQGATYEWQYVNGKGYILTTALPDPAPALAVDAAVRPKERAVAVEGTADAAATAVKIRLLDSTGNVVQLRQDRAATAGVNEVTATFGAVANNRKPFKLPLYLLNAAAAFGPVQLFVSEEGTNPPAVEAFFFHLAGFQTALVKDTVPKTRGNPTDETTDKVVVDFLNSPEANAAAIKPRARGRRMAVYEIDIRRRKLSDTVDKQVVKPEMPMWMAEFQALGLTKEQLRQLLVWRKRMLAVGGIPGPESLRFEFDWQLTMSWEGPCVKHTVATARNHSYHVDFKMSQKVEIKLAKSQQIDAVDKDGVIGNAFGAAPTQIPFPLTDRRLPQVVVSGQRPWGRRQGAASRDILLIEWQPRIENAGAEAMYGGDGRLILENIRVGDMAIDPGLIVAANNAAPAPPPDKDKGIRLPRFRVIGKNPSFENEAKPLIEAIVEEYFNQNQVDRVTALTLKCWQVTVYRILTHESSAQFTSDTIYENYGGKTFGIGKDTPIFGPPHGYGYGQLDNPKVTPEQAWGFVDNIRGAVKLLMGDHATAAWNKIKQHLPAGGADQRTRAVYQREVVRRYNSGTTEFTWNADKSEWQISPGLDQLTQNFGEPGHSQDDYPEVANPALAYPDKVLKPATNVKYWTDDPVSGKFSDGDEHAPTFSWPIKFEANSFGPEV